MAALPNLLSGSPLVVFQESNQAHGDVVLSLSEPEAVLTRVDRRKPVVDSKKQPYGNILYVTATYTPIANHVFKQDGTAFLTDQVVYYQDEPFVVALTAAHVLCPETARSGAGIATALCGRRPDDLATSVHVQIAVNGSGQNPQETPYATFEIYRRKNLTTATSDHGWYEVSPNWYNKSGADDSPNWREDYGALYLRKSLLPKECTGFSLSSDPVVFSEIQFGRVTCAGYPGDKENGTMWWSEGCIRCPSTPVAQPLSLDSYIPQAEHSADTAKGQSGSPLFLSVDLPVRKHIAVAIHHKGPGRPVSKNEIVMACNEALLIDKALMNRVLQFEPPQEWVSRFGRHATPGTFVAERDSTMTAAMHMDTISSDTTTASSVDTSIDSRMDTDMFTFSPTERVSDNFADAEGSYPTTCRHVDSRMSASNPFVGSDSQRLEAVFSPTSVLDASHASDKRPAAFSKGDLLSPRDLTLVEGPIEVTQQPQREVSIPSGENVNVACEAISQTHAELFYQWYYLTAGSGAGPSASAADGTPIGSGQVLRLVNVQDRCKVYCTVSDYFQHQVTSSVCEISIDTGEAGHGLAAGAPAGLTDTSPMLETGYRPGQGAMIAGIERNISANLDGAGLSSPPSPWESPGFAAVLHQLEAEMDAAPVCNRLTRQKHLSENDMACITQSPDTRARNKLLVDKIKGGGWRTLEALYQALMLTGHGALGERLHKHVKTLPGYPMFETVAAPKQERDRTTRKTKLTEDMIDSCKETLTGQQVVAVASCLSVPDRLQRFALKAGLEMQDIEVNCPCDSGMSANGHAIRVLTYLANGRGMTVRKALRVANHRSVGCGLSVRKALLSSNETSDSDS